MRMRDGVGMSNNLQRKPPNLKTRLTACQFCDYPISQRHHALPFSVYGENSCTLQLCSNCHELYHIVETCYLNPTKRSKALLASFTKTFGEDDIRFKKATHFIAAAINLANGETNND